MKKRIKNHNNWVTPPYILQYIKAKYFNNKDFYDPCPLNADFNGLLINWKKRNYINPPYDRITKEKFIIKAYEESQKNKICVMLLPVSTSTAIFHNIILPNAEIEFLKGRIKFLDGNETPPKSKIVGMFDSMIIKFK
jgi:hypothetical protein